MIENITLKNWRSHSETTINFAKGTNVLLGIMGSGKTSILQAICFALFGELPELRTRKIKLNDLLMRKPKQAKTAEVELTFAVDGTTYVVKRAIEFDGGSTAEIRSDGRLVEVDPKKVTNLVEKILKVDYPLFEQAVYAEQNQLDYFLTIPKGKRMERVDQMLRLDRLEDGRKTLSSIITNTTRDASLLSTELKGFDFQKEEAELRKLTDEILTLEKQRLEAQELFTKAVLELTYKQGEAKRLETLKEEIERTVQKLKTLEGKLSTLVSEKAKAIKALTVTDPAAKLRDVLSEVKETEKNVNKLRKESEDSYHKATGLTDSLARDEQRLRKSANELNKRRIELVKFEKATERLKSAKEDLTKTEKELATISAQLTTAQDSHRLLEDAEGKCPTCDAKLNPDKRSELMRHKRKHIADAEIKEKELEKDVKKLEKQIAELSEQEGQLNGLKAEIKELEKSERELEKLESEKKKAHETLKEAEEKKKEAENEIEKLTKNLDELNTKRAELTALVQLQERVKELDKEISTGEAQIHELQKSLNLEKFDPHQLAKLKDEIIVLSQRKALFETAVRDKSLVEEKKKRARELEERLRENRLRAEKRNKIVKANEIAQVLHNVFRDSQVLLRTKFIEEINTALDELWPLVYPYRDFTSARLFVESDGKKSGDYSLQLQEGDRWVDVEGIVSGGERSLACLALRIAFARVLVPNLRWLLLDEPTHNLDAKGVTELATALRERIPDIVDQVILITHEEGLESAVTGYCYKLYREKGRNEPTQVKELISA